VKSAPAGNLTKGLNAARAQRVEAIVGARATIMGWDTIQTISKSDLHRADILLWDGSAPQSVAIKYGTWSYVSHVALCTGYDQVIEALANGITRYDKGSMEDWFASSDHVMVLRHKQFTSAGPQDSVCAHAESYINTPYDFAKIGDMSLRATGPVTYWAKKKLWERQKAKTGYPPDDDVRFICSEFVVRMYDLSGYRIVGDAPWVAPGDFLSTSHGNFITTDGNLDIVGKLK
jgi:hypothetical protein